MLWVLNTTDLCQSARHRATVRLARTAMEQSGLTRWNVAELGVLYNLQSTTNKIKELRPALESASRRPTRRKIVLRAGASIRVRLATYIFD